MDNLATTILGVALMIIMLGMGLSLVKEDFKRIFLNPKAIFVGLINQLVLLPIIGLVLISIFPLRPEIAIGIMILAACPGGPTSNLISHLAKADIALSVSLTAFSSLITIITIPFVINFALEHILSEGQMVKLDVVDVIKKLMLVTVLPVVIGMVIRSKSQSFAEEMAKPVRIASAIILVVVILGIVLKEKENVVSYFEQAGLVALALNVATMLVGYFTAKMMQIRDNQAVSISIESGIQNGTLAIAIAVALLNNSEYAIAPAVYSLIMFLTGGVLVYWGINKSKKATLEE